MSETAVHPDRSTTSAARSGDAALQRAEAAFAAGDHAELRSLLGELERSDDEQVKERAARLALAIRVDPALAAVLAACLLGFAVVFAHYVLG